LVSYRTKKQLFIKNTPFLLYLHKRINTIVMTDLEKQIKKYKEIDKIRIEAESDAEKKKRIYIGIGILLAGLGIVLIASKKLNG